MSGGHPDFGVDPSLPIAAHQAEIAALLLGHQVLIVAGETGSGKTTQLPKIALALGRERIGHTQPRRIAARSVAARIAQETGTQLGDVVGYQVRFTRQAGPATRLKLMTDGILLAEVAHDRWLRRYDTIIVDEAHERSLNIDFLLGYLKQLLPHRPDMKVVITSATIDTAKFARHFDEAPIVEVSGRGFPIELRYEPAGETDQPDAIVKALRGLPPEDTLVFLAGEREIRDAAAAIEAARLRDTHVLPLYARLSLDDQARVFAPHEGRRVVLATNVAETSLTVPGIRCVIDPGFARIARYSARAKVQRLPIEPISQASADQRAGRCGRVAPGICVRLYSEDDYWSRPAFTEPEILRTNLASVILAMAQARLGDINAFPFVDAPDRRRVDDGVRLLTELGAVTGEAGDLRLTPIGRQLSQLPIDPSLARIVLEGNALGCLREAIVVAAALSLPDVRERPLERREAADAMHARFASDAALATSQEPAPAVVDAPTGPARITVHTGWGAYLTKKSGAGKRDETGPAPDPGGDVAATLRLWRYLADAQRDASGSQFRKLCQREFLSYPRVREWQDLVSQLRAVTKEMKMHASAGQAPIENVLRACLSGLLSHIGALQEPTEPASKRRGPHEYLGARGARFAIAPDSVLARRTPPFVVAVELVETSRLWAHGVAAVEPDWIEQAAGPFLRRSYSEPVFSAKARRVLVSEHTSLFGVPLTTNRVDYATVDREAARDIFIQSGLVEGQLTARAGSPARDLLDHNAGVLAQIEGLETKTRRRGLAVPDEAVAAWFAARLPGDVLSGPTLDAWLRSRPDRAQSLMLGLDDLLSEAPPPAEDFPDRWVVGEADFGLVYRFEPGHPEDGVTVQVPLAKLAGLDPAPFSWGVPGQRLELATALIRGLPKAVRRHVVPAPEFAARALAWLDEHGTDRSSSFADALGAALTALTGERITGWDPDALPDHLRPLFRVGGQAGRDLEALQAKLGRQVHKTLSDGAARQARSGRSWVFGALPSQVLLRRAGVETVAYPALQDARTLVRETYAATPGQARRTHRRGVVRLLALNLPDLSKGVFANLPGADLSILATGPYASVSGLLADARDAAIGQLLDEGDAWEVRDAPAFERALIVVRSGQGAAMTRVVRVAVDTLARLGKVETALARQPAESAVAGDVAAQVRDLVFDGFLHAIPARWLPRVPVWLDGVVRRLAAAAVAPDRDQRGQAELAPVLDAYARLVRSHPDDDEVDNLGFLIEELRLQVLAQPVRTVETVSVKRLLKAIEAAGEPPQA